MKPYGIDQAKALEAHFEILEALTEQIGRHRYTFVELRNQFKKLKDLSGSLSRIEKRETLTVPELFEIKSMILIMGEIAGALSALKWESPDELRVSRIKGAEALLDPESQGVNTFYLYSAYSEALASIRKAVQEVDEEMRRLQKQKRLELEDQLGIRIRPNGELTVSKENKELIKTLENNETLTYSAETYMNITFRIREDEQLVSLQAQKDELVREEDEEFPGKGNAHDSLIGLFA